MTEVGLLAALLAGALALLSPCSALLLPSFFAYAFASRSALVGRTVLFYLGLLLTLVPLGTGAAAASALFYGHRALLISVAGWTVVALGVLVLLGRGFALPFTTRLQAWAVARPDGMGSTVLLGAVYGLAGFCSGPVLGAILTVAAGSGSPVWGGTLLAVYALGMTLPLFAMAALWDRFDLGRRRWLRGRTLAWGRLRVHTTSVVTGLLLVAIGVLFLRYDGTAGITGSFGFGDTADLEADAQEWVARVASSVPDWSVPAVIAVIAGLWAVRRTRSDASPRETHDQEEANSPGA